MSESKPSPQYTPLPPKPQPPAEGECCKSGCFPCVWDYYRMALDDWEKQRQNHQNSKSP